MLPLPATAALSIALSHTIAVDVDVVVTRAVAPASGISGSAGDRGSGCCGVAQIHDAAADRAARARR
jgi:hypothetical protein